MKNKIFIILIVCVFLVGITCSFIISFGVDVEKVDTININEIVHIVNDNIDSLNKDLFTSSKYDFSIFNKENELIFSYGENSLDDLNNSVKAGFITLNLKGGNIISFNVDIYDSINRIKNIYLAILIVSLFLFVVLIAVYFVLIHYKMIRPFKNLKNFASEVSKGNLETPLRYEKDNYFGDFTESFDLLREELKQSRKKEHLLEIAKKETISKICHDIKTPIASIKAVAELMQVKETYDAKGTQVLIDKTSQLDNLITDIVSVSIKEEKQLTINLNEYTTNEMKQFLLGTDYYNKIEVLNDVDNLILSFDKARLIQVFDNLVSNSYKYADTKIYVSFESDDYFVYVHISDDGKLINKEDALHLFEKNYRGENSEDIKGQGLGLYISKHLLISMNGDLKYTSQNGKNEFIVNLLILQ